MEHVNPKAVKQNVSGGINQGLVVADRVQAKYQYAYVFMIVL
ncbi:unnamed protein product, partial [Brassica rapa subsp. trilocularis]